MKIDWQAGDGIWNAFADQAQLELALVNLIINARDAMPDGGKVTSPRERTLRRQLGRAADRRLCLLSVTDTGNGIAPASRKGDEPFFTTKELGKGSGLGLSMVYGFAKQSNGAFRIAASSARARPPSVAAAGAERRERRARAADG